MTNVMERKKVLQAGTEIYPFPHVVYFVHKFLIFRQNTIVTVYIYISMLICNRSLEYINNFQRFL